MSVKALAKDEGKVPPGFLPSGASAELSQGMAGFFELSSLYRKSGAEANVRNHLKAIALANGITSIEEDEAGNLKIFVPGTGPFADWGETRSVALQSHMDMVLDVDGLQSSLEQERLFKSSGIRLVNEQGWVHSEGYKTSIGADDGMGVVSMIRYLSDAAPVHPPLDLVFTANEENGFTGAKGLTLQPRVKALLNLDGNEVGTVTVGGHGYTRLGVGYPLKAVRIGSKSSLIRIEVSGLHGGHSGLNGHDGYASGASLLSSLLVRIGAIPGASAEWTVLNADAGDSAYNKIPDYFNLTLALPAAEIPRFRQTVQKLVDGFVDEAVRNSKGLEPSIAARVSVLSPEAGVTHSGVALQKIAPLARVLERLPNGIVTDRFYTEADDLTSNFAFLHLDPDANTDGFKLTAGIMPRFLKDESGARFTREMRKLLGSEPGSGMTVINDASGPAWTPQPRSALAEIYGQALSGVMPGQPLKREISKGGLETGQFAERYPELPMIAIAQANIRDEHSRRESFELQSLETGIRLLDRFLVELAASDFLTHL